MPWNRIGKNKYRRKKSYHTNGKVKIGKISNNLQIGFNTRKSQTNFDASSTVELLSNAINAGLFVNNFNLLLLNSIGNYCVYFQYIWMNLLLFSCFWSTATKKFNKSIKTKTAVKLRSKCSNILHKNNQLVEFHPIDSSWQMRKQIQIHTKRNRSMINTTNAIHYPDLYTYKQIAWDAMKC